jgi:L-rhamnose isomerase
MSGSRLVTHMNRFESKIPNLRICVMSWDPICSFTRFRTFGRGGRTADVFGHLSKASTMR